MFCDGGVALLADFGRPPAWIGHFATEVSGELPCLWCFLWFAAVFLLFFARSADHLGRILYVLRQRCGTFS